MSEQTLGVFDEIEHDRTGGPSGFLNSDCFDGTPLQEQVEKVEAHNLLLEDALTKCTDVIAALMGERKDLTEQVYQAQVDAQDWQNRYTSLSNQPPATGQPVGYAQLRLKDELKANTSLRGNIRGLESKIKNADAYIADRESLLENCRQMVRDENHRNDELTKRNEELFERIQALTHDNTQLEVRNERQRRMIEYAQRGLNGRFNYNEEL